MAAVQVRPVPLLPCRGEKMATPPRLELGTYNNGSIRSTQLSYGVSGIIVLRKIWSGAPPFRPRGRFASKPSFVGSNPTRASISQKGYFVSERESGRGAGLQIWS